jgi:hypothetical protein
MNHLMLNEGAMPGEANIRPVYPLLLPLFSSIVVPTPQITMATPSCIRPFEEYFL